MLTLTKNIIKEIRSLEQRKGRREQQAWLVEGNKSVGDLLAAHTFHCRRLVATAEWWQQHADTVADECFLASRSDMERTSLLPSPQDVLAVFSLPNSTPLNPSNFSSPSNTSNSTLIIALDEVQDPGNLGTIIRTADWFGIRHIVCAPGTADCFAPKVVQATMSALARVQVHYFDSRQAMATWMKDTGLPIYGTFLEGQNIYATPLTPNGILLMGNEGRGISPDLAPCVTHKLLIPDFAPDGQHVESLNVSVATAICISEIRRR